MIWMPGSYVLKKRDTRMSAVGLGGNRDMISDLDIGFIWPYRKPVPGGLSSL
jgi:hypothetical protein